MVIARGKCHVLNQLTMVIGWGHVRTQLVYALGEGKMVLQEGRMLEKTMHGCLQHECSGKANPCIVPSRDGSSVFCHTVLPSAYRLRAPMPIGRHNPVFQHLWFIPQGIIGPDQIIF